MKLRKKIEIALVSALCISLMLSIILLTQYATSQPIEKTKLEVSKIKFNQPLDPMKKTEVKAILRAIPGIKGEVIIQGNTAVCLRDAQVCDEQKIMDQLIAGHYFGQICKLTTEYDNSVYRGKLHRFAIATTRNSE
ncbi:MAG: hypothetical protein JST78_00525 [Bacteroidetes bacterium]|nr:hypothetical protein [Bacteroidota bacterium]